MDKRWLLAGVLAIGVALLVVLVVPFFANADTFRPALETQLSAALGRKVTLGSVSFSLLEGSLIAQDVAVSDDPEFSNVPFIQAKALKVHVGLIPLVLHRKVNIDGLTLDSPSMQLIEHESGRWNYSSLGSAASDSSPPQGGTALPGLTIARLQIVNGSALVSSIPETARPFQYSDLNLMVNQFSLLKTFPFELSAKLPGSGTINVTGEAGPVAPKDASQTPLHGKLQMRDFDPVAARMIDQGKGISMLTDVDGDVASDGTNITSTGKINASRLQLAAKGSPAQQPVEMDYSITQNLVTREGKLSDLAIHIGSSAVHVKGTFKPSGNAMILDFHLSAPGLPMEEIDRLLPVVGIDLPSGSSLQGGTLTADLAITGPATSATTTGPVEINNTRLARFDLGSKIEGLNAIEGTAGGTDIRVLKANVNSSPEGTRLTDIYGELPQIGTASGDGTVASAGELEFHLTAKLNGASAAGSSQQTKANAASQAGRTVPLIITGAAESPSIRVSARAAR